MKDKINLLIQANRARIERRYQDAIDYYIRYLKRYDNADVMDMLAQVYFLLGIEQSASNDASQKALEWIEKALEQQPNNAEFYVTRGVILSQGVDVPNYIEAAESFRKALQLRPNLASAHLGLSSLKGVPDQVVSLSEALVSVKKASEIEPGNPDIFLRLGTLYLQAGQESNAWDAYECALLRPQPLALSHVVEIMQRVL